VLPSATVRDGFSTNYLALAWYAVAREKINAASIAFRTCCRSVDFLYGGPNAISNTVGYAMHYSRSHSAVNRVYDNAGNVIETH
jgi:hypothetical protein